MVCELNSKVILILQTVHVVKKSTYTPVIQQLSLCCISCLLLRNKLPESLGA